MSSTPPPRAAPPPPAEVPAPRAQRHELVPEPLREHRVERREDLGARAEVVGQGQRGALLPERAAATAEDLDVGVTEAVDRLELVADGGEVVALERLEQREL